MHADAYYSRTRSRRRACQAFGAIVAVVDNLQRPERLVPLIEDLGRRHAAYGVNPDSFDAVGTALIGAIGDFDDQLADPTRAAWGRAYARIAQAIQCGLAAERVTVPPGTHDPAASAGRDTPPTRDARSGEVGIAYQVIGNGQVPPRKLVVSGPEPCTIRKSRCGGAAGSHLHARVHPTTYRRG